MQFKGLIWQHLIKIASRFAIHLIPTPNRLTISNIVNGNPPVQRGLHDRYINLNEVNVFPKNIHNFFKNDKFNAINKKLNLLQQRLKDRHAATSLYSTFF